MTERLDVRWHRSMIRFYEGGLKRRPVFGYWRELEQSQWWDPQQLETLRTTRLVALLHHAARSSPWYATQWRALGLDPSTITSTGDLTRWPVIDRETIRANRMTMRSTAPGIRLISKATGGSSGVPLLRSRSTRKTAR